MYSFKELMITPIEDGEDEYLKYRAMKRRKHMYEETAVEEESTDEALSMASRRKRSRYMRKNKNKLKKQPMN